MFILTERTPNPDAMKFIPHVQLITTPPCSFRREAFEPSQSPLADRLFEIADVDRVHIADTFITVSRNPDGQTWATMRIHVISAIADHLQSGAPALARHSVTVDKAGDDEIEAEIRSVLGLYVRPGVARDGGDILFDKFDRDTGVLWITMHGACGGCPSSRLTLKAGVERIVRRYVPEVVRVDETPTDSPGKDETSRLRAWATRLTGIRAAAVRPRFTYRGRDMAASKSSKAADA